MATSYMKQITGVFGCPIEENPTKVMQQAAYDVLNLPYLYLNFRVEEGGLQKAIEGARAMGFAGFNCTIPHKVEVLKYLDEVEPDALVMGAVNTVYRKGDKLIGANTDGKGFMSALERSREQYLDKNITILGSGGAARAICTELALHGVKRLTIANRTPQRGQELCALINEKTPCTATYLPWDGNLFLPEDTQILINTTPSGMLPDTSMPLIDYGCIKEGMLVCDVIPNPPQTPFLKEAQRRGAKTLDGLAMLVYQGALAFTLWTGLPAPVAEMFGALKAEFESEKQ